MLRIGLATVPGECALGVKVVNQLADSRVMMGAIATLAFAACVAGIIPARRAASIDPVQALRTE
jgi:ABC-type lipoprotein release transport system permease subunit